MPCDPTGVTTPLCRQLTLRGGSGKFSAERYRGDEATDENERQRTMDALEHLASKEFIFGNNSFKELMKAWVLIEENTLYE